MRSLSVICLLAVVAALAGPAPADEIQVFTEEAPPFNFSRNGQVTGSATELVREILERVGQPGNIQVLPWARGYHMLQTRSHVALYSTARTPEREKQFHWIGPLHTVHFGFYAKRDRNLGLNSLEDAKNVGAIATYKNDVREQLLLSMGFANLDSSKSPVSNLKKLMAGRVDLWLFDNVGMPDVARQVAVDPAELELVLPFRSYQSYVAISKQTPAAVVERWRAAFEDMVRDGSFQAISRRWLPVASIPDFNPAGQYAAGTPTLRIFTEDSPPGNYLKAGRPAGFAVEVVREILKRLKHPDTISVVPWSRGYTLARNAANVALFSTTRLKQREQLFQWVGPLYTQTWAFYARKGSGIRVNSLEEAKAVGHIGTYLKDAKEQYLQSKGFQNLVSANRNISNIRHLMNGHIDLWVSSDFNMPYQVRQAGIDPDQLEMVFAFHQVSNYVAFSLDTPAAVVRSWQRCLDRIKQDGTYQRLARKYTIDPQPD